MSGPIVYKFGGASLKDAEAFRQLARIIELADEKPACIVLSAMGKTTNALEYVVSRGFHGADTKEEIKRIADYHKQIMLELFPREHEVFTVTGKLFSRLNEAADYPVGLDYDQYYDAVVPFGELLSSTILSRYLEQTGISNTLVDAREMITCTPPYRAGIVDWTTSRQKINAIASDTAMKPWITQGFIAGTTDGHSITLGREGSDYTAALIAAALDASAVHIWKDVPGLMNADPALFPDAHKFDSMPYGEAIVLSFYGAKVIHPKTIKPLENQEIPLWVRPFREPSGKGTLIAGHDKAEPELCSVILKTDQLLFTLQARDYAFINEEHIHEIMGILCEMNIRINLMQSSALHFSFCLDTGRVNIPELVEKLSRNYFTKYNEGMRLLTLRHYQAEDITRHVDSANVVMEQRTRVTYQALLKQA